MEADASTDSAKHFLYFSYYLQEADDLFKA